MSCSSVTPTVVGIHPPPRGEGGGVFFSAGKRSCLPRDSRAAAVWASRARVCKMRPRCSWLPTSMPTPCSTWMTREGNGWMVPARCRREGARWSGGE